MRAEGFVLGMVLLLPALAPAIVYVDASATGANDGSDWTNAYTDLRSALASPGDEFWVAEGTYTPAGPGGDREASFILQTGRALYGGFAGGETQRDPRDPAAHPTVLSGDLNGDDAPGWVNMQPDNSYHVVTGNGVDDSAVLDGFVIRAGWSWESTYPHTAGAGIRLETASPTIAHCVVENNLAHSGAGLLCISGAPTIRDCTFRGNYASDGRGGALYHAGPIEGPAFLMTIERCRFLDNLATVGGGPGDAGAIWSDFSGPIDVVDTLFEGNQALWRFTAGSFAANGGAAVVFGAGSRFLRCVFRDNRAHIGGALWIARDTKVADCLFVANEAFRQSVGAYDYGGYAGAAYCAGGTNAIVNSTFHVNTARSVGGVYAGGGSTTIVNSVLWTNTSTEEEATLLDRQIGGSPVLRYSCIQGVLTPVPGEDPPDPANVPGCIDADPLHRDPAGPDGIPGTADDDVRLAAGSPCIDAGDNAALPAWLDTDFDGRPRRADDPSQDDTGFGESPIVDLGAFEGPPPPEGGVLSLY